MKYLKTYEELNIGEPEIGDYVICYEKPTYLNMRNVNYINNHIGKYVRYDQNIIHHPYLIEYDDYIFDNIDLKKNQREMSKSEIKYWSKNKSDLETILSANKYNL